MKPPFPFFGGKARWADEVWSRFGAPDFYAEPFVGGGGVLLGRPGGAGPHEVLCDADGAVANFWRAMAADADAVAGHADWPRIQQDLTARHTWLRRWLAEHREHINEDPHFFNAKAAGWWVWGISQWIGGGWCQSSADQIPMMIKNGVHVLRAQAVRGQAQDPQPQPDALRDAFREIQSRLSLVVVLNRSWEAALTPSVLTKNEPGIAAVFLDPPYLTDDREKSLYASDTAGASNEAATDAWQWALDHGDEYRVAYACHEGDVQIPDGWDYSVRAFKGVSSERAQHRRDMVAYSPACLGRQQPSLFDA